MFARGLLRRGVAWPPVFRACFLEDIWFRSPYRSRRIREEGLDFTVEDSGSAIWVIVNLVRVRCAVDSSVIVPVRAKRAARRVSGSLIAVDFTRGARMVETLCYRACFSTKDIIYRCRLVRVYGSCPGV